MTDRTEWTVVCRDGVGRDREIRVRLAGFEVIVQVPPGEAAVLNAEQLADLMKALREAQHVAHSRAEHVASVRTSALG